MVYLIFQSGDHQQHQQKLQNVSYPVPLASRGRGGKVDKGSREDILVDSHG